MTAWRDVNRVLTREPGPTDLFVLTLADGKRIDLCAATGYHDVLVRAERLAASTGLAIKVLPMTYKEIKNILGLPDWPPATAEEAAECRALIVATCSEVLRDCDEQSVRAEALALLQQVGGVQ